jgi:hypothetical protein
LHADKNNKTKKTEERIFPMVENVYGKDMLPKDMPDG